MEGENVHLICHICQKKFSSVSAKNRHLRSIHHEDQVMTQTSSKYIKCPLCPEDQKIPLGSHELLIKHLESFHSLNIKVSLLNFRNKDEFEAWRAMNNRSVDYTIHATSKTSTGKLMYYDCNRSKVTEYTSQCAKRSMKTGGSIKISGFCPSRIHVKICNDAVTVKFFETHVGHDDDLRSKRLTTNQQQMIASKLLDGVTKERILEDSRTVKDGKIERINILTRGDLDYIIRKFNIDKRRDKDDMVATALKVKEWNSQGKNHVFLFKQIGESYPGLKDEDFALAYMNSNMERKLREFKRIVCIDGTHGTNARNWELTIVLIKDENKIGFPVAFLISNRLDQAIQKIFFESLKTRLGEAIDTEYIMTDDDVKYYNAWCQVMATNNKPRRLLCTWHVIKNWNLQGRNKLKKLENKKEMKIIMRKIMNETNTQKFIQLREEYFSHLQEEGENEFLKYLQNHYFQTDDRIKMWAHCYRINAGINTNMAIESLNKIIKYNKMRGNKNIRVEKLLDILEELVNEKMWKKIIDAERPSANSYHSRVNKEAHAKAENELLGKVVCLESGEFKVQSSSVSTIFYIVTYNELCDEDCRALYCDKCKICIHRFKCQCAEYTVKTALCKHIHAVALIEKRSESVLGLNTEEDVQSSALQISEPSTSRSHYEMDVDEFLKETNSGQGSNEPVDPRQKREIMWEQACLKMRLLSGDSFNKFVKQLDEAWESENNISINKKRKIEKQLYYPNKK